MKAKLSCFKCLAVSDLENTEIESKKNSMLNKCRSQLCLMVPGHNIHRLEYETEYDVHYVYTI